MSHTDGVHGMPQITLLVKWNYCTSTMDFRYILNKFGCTLTIKSSFMVFGLHKF